MADPWAPDILKLAASVTPDIPRIRAILDQLGIRNVDYEDPADYVPSAFANAWGRGKLVPFQAALAKAGLITDGPADIGGELFRRLATLQTFSSSAYTPTHARVAARRLLLASDLVCRIDVDDGHGTGILVAPTLVATAAHVVSDLVDEQGPGPAVPRDGSTSRIHVTFGDVTDLLDDGAPPTRLTGTPAPLAAKWLAFYSPPTRDEVAGDGFVLDSVDGIAAEEGPWDLAILRLAEAWPFNPLPPRKDIPQRPFQIHVLHHPDDGTGTGLPMLWSVGTVDKPLGDPPVRLLHSANTSGGSSGAPVFDRNFRVVGLHQAGVPPAPGQDGAACNRAVPVLRWSSKLASLELPETPPLLRTVEKLDEQGYPVTRTVIGRLDTQRRIWRSRFPDATPSERLIAVTGEPGLGLRFTKHLVHAIVTRFGGAYAAIDVANCQHDDATAFADKVAGTFAASTGARPSTGFTTRQREVRSLTAPALSETLEAIGRTGGAWLVLEGFDSTVERPSAAVVDLVRQLILELPQSPGVRLVLAGWQETLPSAFEASIEYLEPPSAEDIARTLLPPDPSPDALEILGAFVEEALSKAEEEMPGACPYVIAERARAAVAAKVRPRLRARASESGGAS
jgi:hypothetical protein